MEHRTVTRYPTARQAVELAKVRDGNAHEVTSKDLAAFTRNEWVEPGDEDRRRFEHSYGETAQRVVTVPAGPPGSIRLSLYGEYVLGFVEARDDYERLIPYGERHNVMVHRRPLGTSRIRGINGMHYGKEVTCRLCPRNPDRRTGPVWSVNYTGREAQRDAEHVMRTHHLQHHRGEIPTRDDL